jgi:hypothetical protein
LERLNNLKRDSQRKERENMQIGIRKHGRKRVKKMRRERGKILKMERN